MWKFIKPFVRSSLKGYFKYFKSEKWKKGSASPFQWLYQDIWGEKYAVIVQVYLISVNGFSSYCTAGKCYAVDGSDLCKSLNYPCGTTSNGVSNKIVHLNPSLHILQGKGLKVFIN